MNSDERYAGRDDSLSRLDRSFYRGQAYVHWTLTMENRGTGWLIPVFYYVLRDEERAESAFASVAEYIARNPERRQLVPIDGYREYKFTGCLIPGYPELNPWLPDYWTRFWRAYSFLQKNGLFRTYDEEIA